MKSLKEDNEIRKSVVSDPGTEEDLFNFLSFSRKQKENVKKPYEIIFLNKNIGIYKIALKYSAPE